jgi:hypothetical protein
MKTRILVKNKPIFCAFEGECEFKKMLVKRRISEPKAVNTICTWKGRCNQQIEREEASLKQTINEMQHSFF